MSLTQQVRDALDRRRIQPASTHLDGYHFDNGPAGSVIVRWGRGEPFDGTQAPKRFLRSCARALTSQRFNVAPGVSNDSGGNYIVVLSTQPSEC
jgi:hypothetical protein